MVSWTRHTWDGQFQVGRVCLRSHVEVRFLDGPESSTLRDFGTHVTPASKLVDNMRPSSSVLGPLCVPRGTAGRAGTTTTSLHSTRQLGLNELLQVAQLDWAKTGTLCWEFTDNHLLIKLFLFWQGIADPTVRFRTASGFVIVYRRMRSSLQLN